MTNLWRFLFGTLRGRLIVGVAAVHALMMALFIGDLTVRQRLMLLERQAEEATALSHALAVSAAGWIAADDVSGLQELVAAQSRYPELLFAILTDRDGRVLAATDSARQGLYLQDLPDSPRQTVLAKTPALVDVATPAMLAGRPVGWARVGIGQKAAGQKLAAITRSGVGYALAAILFGSVIAWFMGRQISRRLYAVQDTIAAVRAGNWAARSTLTGADEAAVIADEFNRMLDALAVKDSELGAKTAELDHYFNDALDLLCIADSGGRFLRLNPEWEATLGIPVAELVGQPILDCVHPDDQEATRQALADLGAQKAVRNFINRYLHRNGDYRWIEWRAFPAGQRIYAVARDITDRRRAEAALHRLNRELEAITRCNQILMRAKDEQSLVDEICRIAYDETNYCAAWVGYVEQDEAKTVRPVAQAGVAAGYFEQTSFTWADTTEGQRPAGAAIRRGETICIQDIRSEREVSPWSASLCQYDYRATVALPLKDEQGRAFGVLVIYAPEPNAFSAKEVALLEALAADLAFGISVLRARAARQQAEQEVVMMSFALNNVHETAFLIDENARFHYVNEESCRVLGYSREALLGMGVGDVDPDFPPERWPSHWQELKARGSLTFEGRHRTKDGNILPVEVNANYIEYEGRGYNLALVRDIRERRQAAEALKRSEAFNKEILDAVDDGFIVVDHSYRILSANKAFCDMVQIPEHQLLGRTCHESAHQSLLPCSELGTDCPVQLAFATGQPQIAAHSHETKTGTAYAVELKAFPILGDDGAVVSVIETIHDVTEKKQLETQLLQAQKMESIGRLAGGVAHDFNNMLGVIIGYTEMALDQIDPALPIVANLTEIEKAAKRSADLTRQLLAFARKQTISPKVLDLNETVEGMLKMLRRMIGEDIDLAWLPGTAVWPLKMDPSQIDQILANLCVNARDAIAGEGKISIETRNRTVDAAYCKGHLEAVTGDYVQLAVSDTGCGMNREAMGKLFEPFFTTKAVGKGTGLGLATVYGIVKQNNGFINVYSEPGQGSTFKIHLPRFAAKGEELRTERLVIPVARDAETILLVEDEAATLKMTRYLLEGFGYRVLPAALPSEAIRLAKEQAGRIDLLLTDVVMPEMNGRLLAQRLIALYPGLRCLFMSGYTANVLTTHGVVSQDILLIQKPFSRPELAAKVREALDRRTDGLPGAASTPNGTS